MKAAFILLILMLGLMGSGISQDIQRDVQDHDTTLSWLNGIEADVDLGGYHYDYFFEYFIPEADGYINSIDFNFSDLPDIPGCGIGITIFFTDYPDWDEIETCVIADSCGAGHLGYYLNENALGISSGEWIQGGINTLDGAIPGFNYDPLDGQLWPAFGRGSLSLEPNELDEGLVNFDLMHYITDSSILANTPLAIVVQLFCQDSSVLDSTQTRMGFYSAQLDQEPQPCLKFFHPQSNPNGNCGEDDWGWYIQSHVWDWRVNVTYTGPLGIDPLGALPNRPEIISIFPNPFNPTTTIEYEIQENSEVSLKIFDVAGREVNTLVNISQAAGQYAVNWGGFTFDGQQVAGGMYFAGLQAGEYSSVVKMVYLK
ncbi:MAG: T9SS type A sorting domain-containing protein [FCB group bacterium]|nr:T9SS type A sorting domain-containing protein [FCB group bacterium]MBL7027267.1 T9SS type A sorting domain-containing protein [Candidatus Neomarinimicrobiota bacterium]MBL7122237.1 T9SS type A sorting domain-containing protein [Candidatus Neomarinimicrobiota bacterium]